jgi:HK97 family phage major capsid protein
MSKYAVKSVNENILTGRAIVFGGKDVVGDEFTADTDLGESRSFVGTPVYWNHGMSGTKTKIGEVTDYTRSEEGIDVTIELDKRGKYLKQIMDMAKRGMLGLSSGAVAHLVERMNGVIKTWIWGELSITTTPAEPRTYANVKSASAEASARDHVAGYIINPLENLPIKEETTMTIDKDALKDALLDIAGDTAQGGGVYMGGKAPSAKSVTKMGFSNEANDAWIHYMKTGDKGAVKATLVEGTDANGGFNVPNELQTEIVAKRDEKSILGALPITRRRTSRDYYDVNVGQNDSDFAFTAETVSANFDEPTFAQSSIRIYKATLAMKISEELLNDSATDVQGYLTDQIGEALARHVNQYILTGSGSSQPYGVAGRAALSETLASATGVDAADINNIFYKLPSAYHGAGTGWAMRMATLGGIRALTGNPFLFQNTPAGVNGLNGEFLSNRPVFTSDKVAAPTTGLTSILFGDWSKYYFVENGGLTVRRNEYAYMENGLIGIFATVRWGGDAVITNAFVKGVQA